MNNRRKEKFNQIYQASSIFRSAKRETIHCLASFGRRHKYLRFPVLMFLTLFIFIYNVFLYLFIGLKMEEKAARALAFLLIVVLFFTGIDLNSLAAEVGESITETVVEETSEENIEGASEENIEEASEENIEEVSEENIEGASEENIEEASNEILNSQESDSEKTVSNLEVPINTEETNYESMPANTEETSNPEGSANPEETALSDAEIEAELSDNESLQILLSEEERFTALNLRVQTLPNYETYQTLDEIAKQEIMEEINDIQEQYDLLSKASKTKVDLSIMTNLLQEIEHGLLAVAFDQSCYIDDVMVRVKADPFVFPDNCTLSVNKVENITTLNEIANTLIGTRTNNDHISSSYTFDIKVLDKNGNEVEPDNSKGQVWVSFSLEKASNENLDKEIYHVSENEQNKLEASVLDTRVEPGEMKACTDGFSYYVVEFTYEDKQYVLPGDTQVALSQILDTIGLHGEVSSIATSSPSLIGITGANGTYMISALCAFSSWETLLVTIDGIEYLIQVTDSANLTDDLTATQEAVSDFMKYNVTGNSFNINGMFNGNMIKTTYSDSGYRTAVKVGNGSQTDIMQGSPFVYGKVYTVDGVQTRIKVLFTDNGRGVQIIYELHNTTASDLNVSIGSSADTMIGNNDSAKVSFSNGGILMADNSATSSTKGAQFKLIPGDNAFTTSWYGYYGSAYSNMYTQLPINTDAYNSDSGIAWSWNMDIPAGETVIRYTQIVIDSVFELGDVTLTADTENNAVHAVVPYEDTMNATQTLHYSIDGSSSFTSWDETRNTNSSKNNTFNINIPVESWEDNSSHTISFYLFDTNNMKTRTLSYSIFWPGDGGNATDPILKFANSYHLFADIKAPVGTDITLQEDSQPGFYFTGWNTAVNGNGTNYEAGSKYNLNAASVQTLYAQWLEAASYTVKVYKDGGSYANQTVELYHNGIKIKSLAYDSYKQQYSEYIPLDNYDVYVNGVDTGIHLSETSILATVNYYTVSFQANGHGTAPSAQIILAGNKAVNPGNMSVRDYLFSGWYKESSGTNVWNFATETINQTQTIYAKWSPHVHDWAFTENVNRVEARCTSVIPNECDYYLTGFEAIIAATDANFTGSSYQHAIKTVDNGFNLTGAAVSEINYIGSGSTQYEKATQAPVNVGTYIALLEVQKDSDTYTARAPFQIKKVNSAVITLPQPRVLSYSNTLLQLVTPGNASGGTMVYSLEENGTYSTSVPKAIEAGDYEVWYKVVGDANHYNTSPASVSVSIEDEIDPTGEISISTNRWQQFVSNITFGTIYFNQLQTVTVTAADEGTGVETVSRYVTEEVLTLNQIKDLNSSDWTAMENGGQFTINPDDKYIVYVKITDKADNTIYLSSNGMILDETNPLIQFIEDEGVYCISHEIKVTDTNLKDVTVNGESIKTLLSTDGRYTIVGESEDGEEYEIEAIDYADNGTSYTITIYKEHDFINYETIRQEVAEDGSALLIKEAGCEHGCGQISQHEENRGEVTKKTDPSGGSIEAEIQVEEEIPPVSVSGLDIEVAKDLLSQEELQEITQGDSYVVYLLVSEAEDIPDEEAEQIESSAEQEIGSNAILGMKIDLSLYKKKEEDNGTVVHEDGEKIENADTQGKTIRVSIALPDELKAPSGKKRVYYVLRAHDYGGTTGVVVELLPATREGNILSFETDKFSTYSIWYTQSDIPNTRSQADEDGKTDLILAPPKTWDGSNIGLWSILLMVVVNSFAIFVYYFRKAEKRADGGEK